MANEMALKKGKFGLKSFALSRKKEKDDEMETSRMVKSDGTKVGDIVFVVICVLISLISTFSFWNRFPCKKRGLFTSKGTKY